MSIVKFISFENTMKLENKFCKKILGTVILMIHFLSLISAASYNYRTKHTHPILLNNVDNNHIKDGYNYPADDHRISYLPSSVEDDYLPFEEQPRQRHTATAPARRQYHEKNVKAREGFVDGFVLSDNGKEILELRSPELESALHLKNSHPKKMKIDEPTKIKKKYRYAFVNHGKSNANNHDRPPVQFRSFMVETPKPHAFIAEGQGHGYSIHPVLKFVNEKTDIYGMKTTPWKQLGPNVEIASSGDGAVIDSKSHLNEIKKERAKNTVRNSKPKRAKNSPKNLRSGYHMGEQHALYVATNLDQPVKTIVTKNVLPFDHNSMLKQSDKFEITDAMFAGEVLDKDEAIRNTKGEKIGRIKQESANAIAGGGGGQQLHYIETPPHHHIPIQYQQFAALPATGHAFDAAAIPPLAPKYLPPYNPYAATFPTIATLGKGFVRNIEIEMNSSGVKKTMPALIIPLSLEQLDGVGSYLNTVDSPATPFYLNQPPKPKSNHQFPYDIETPARFTAQEIVDNVAPNTQPSPPSPFETYPPHQLYPTYQYRPSAAAIQPSPPPSPSALQDESGVFFNYQNKHLYSKLPVSYHNSASSLPASMNLPAGAAPSRTPETGKPMPVAFSTQTSAPP